MKRYDLITNYRCGSAIEEMEPSDDGEWVRYEDVAAVRAGTLQEVRREVEKHLYTNTKNGNRIAMLNIIARLEAV